MPMNSIGSFQPTPTPAPKPKPQPLATPAGANQAMPQDGNQSDDGGGLLQSLNNVMSTARYGMSHDDLYKAIVNNQIPNMPQPVFQPGGADLNPEAERYASNYFGSKKWGAPASTAFNMIALSDIPKLLTDPSQVWKNKMAGLRGAIAGTSGE